MRSDANMEKFLTPSAADTCLGKVIFQQLQSFTKLVTIEQQQLRQFITAIEEQLAQQFWAGIDTYKLVCTHAWAIEQVLLQQWQQHCPQTNLTLIATGGFGRGQLHPYSDIDLLILAPENNQTSTNTQLENFIQALWDSGLRPGHSVRTLTQCIADASEDVQFITSLMEARILTGDDDLFQQLRLAIAADKIWPADTFFAAKMAEQNSRHEHYNDTAFNLEPNIKEGPGGMRDIQMIKWITQRHFNTLTLDGLLAHNFLQADEFQRLVDSRSFIWRLRYGLHLLAGRAEDRLLFEYQIELAEKLAYVNAGENLAVEQLMQDYYRNALRVERMNERLLQLFQEELLLQDNTRNVIAINSQFQIRHGYLEVCQPEVFDQHPAALLEIFLCLQQNPAIKGIRATTIRIILNKLHLIDAEFRKETENYRTFVRLLEQDTGIYTQLIRMHRYGVLEKFIPAFGKIVGRMQYDLFHIYTVDQHTLFVIRNLRRFAYGKYRSHFPHGQAVFQRIPRPAIVYLAAFFHDIAKGRGGDHSELGAGDAKQFCQLAALEDKPTSQVVWLVENHLLMSITAQRHDLNDELVIKKFTTKVGCRERLDALYLLTMADIAATDPKLWNAWKDSLLWQLYQACAERLNNKQQVVLREDYLKLLSDECKLDEAASSLAQIFWDSLPDHQLFKLSIDQLSWASMQITQQSNPGEPIISIRSLPDKAYTELLVHSENFHGLFACITQVLDQMRLNILSARLITTDSGLAFDILQINNQQHESLAAEDCQRLQSNLDTALAKREWNTTSKQRRPSKFRYFDDQPELHFEQLPEQALTRMELACLDQPGLLTQLAAIFAQQQLKLHDARIATFGHRVEDAFLLRNVKNQALSEAQTVKLKTAIITLLNEWD